MRKLLLVTTFLIALQPNVYAGLPVPSSYSGKVNNAIGANLSVGMQRRGFAANDPRYNATIEAVAGTATTVALSVGGGVIAGATWPAILAGAGISTVASVAVPWLVNKAVEWYWGTGQEAGKVKVGGQDAAGDPKALPVMPKDWKDPAITAKPGMNFFYDPASGKVRQIFTMSIQANSRFDPPAPYSNGSLNEDFQTPWDGKLTHPYWSRGSLIYQNPTVSGVQYGVYTIPWEYRTPADKPVAAPAIQNYVKPAELPASLSTELAKQPLTAQMLADAVNALWKQAAANNPNVAPYPATDPVTAAEVEPWIKANPDAVPKGEDWFAPVAPSNSSSVPIPTVAPVPNPDPGSDSGNNSNPSASVQCGLPGQSRCAVDVDDSGFQNQHPDLSQPKNLVDQMTEDYRGRVESNQGDHGVSWFEWLPDLRFGAPRIGCEPLLIDFSEIAAGWRISIDICTNPLVLLIKQVEAWLLYVFTAIYIWRRFRSSEIPGGADV